MAEQDSEQYVFTAREICERKTLKRNIQIGLASVIGALLVVSGAAILINRYGGGLFHKNDAQIAQYLNELYTHNQH